MTGPKPRKPASPGPLGRGGAITELARLAAELPHVGAARAWARLDRLTEPQRTAIEDVLRRVSRATSYGDPRRLSEFRRDEGATLARRAQVAERLRHFGEMGGHRRVAVEVSPVEWLDHDRLVALWDALAARPELIGPAVSTDLGRGAISLTVTVAAHDPEAARSVAAHALDEEIGALGLRGV